MSRWPRLQPESSDIMTPSRPWAWLWMSYRAGLHPGVLLYYGAHVHLIVVLSIVSVFMLLTVSRQ